MYIKEIIIDGFKSYKSKTYLKGLDRHFNAITGLNGSGKSNIFDSLCFLLGITSLSHVRATNLNDLIYNKASTGITKASVTAIFNNEDKEGSPIGFESYDEIVVCRTIYQGKSKYYLNGYTSNADQVKTLFQSVQMNINNPHFMILQGKIRQVAHMKPIELLSLLEEAAGTSIYQIKKESSLKMIQKKEAKLKEINKIIEEEIKPQMEKLLKEKELFYTWKSNEEKIQIKQKKLTAFSYYNSTLNLKSKNNELIQFKTQYGNIDAHLKQTEKDIKEANAKIESEELKFKEKYDQSIKDLEHKCSKLNTEIKNNTYLSEKLEKLIAEGQNEIDANNAAAQQLKIKLNSTEKDKEDLQKNMKIYEKELITQKEYLDKLQENLENLKAGKDDNFDVGSIAKQINDCINAKNIKVSEKKYLLNQMALFENEIKANKLKINDLKANINQSQNESIRIQNQIQKIEAELTKFEDDKECSSQFIEVLQKEIQQKIEVQNRIESQENQILNTYASRLEIQFRNPYPNFDRSSVKGRAIRRFKVVNEKYYRALEAVGESKLYNIIVDNDETSSVLLQNRCFNSRVVMIPLNRINYRPIPDNKRNYIEQVTKGEAKLAIDLISFDDADLPAMQYIFGSVYVCPTTEMAMKLAYEKGINVKCVNLDGDSFDPSGVLKGGSHNHMECILEKVGALNEIQSQKQSISEEIFEKKNKIQIVSQKVKTYGEMKRTLDQLKIKEEMFDQQKMNMEIQSLENQVKNADENKKKNEAKIGEITKMEKKYEDELKRLKNEEKELESLKNNSSKRMDVYTKKIEEAKTKIKEKQKQINQLKSNVNAFDYQLEKIKDDIKQKEESSFNDTENIDKSKQELKALKDTLKNLNQSLKTSEAQLYEKKSDLTQNEKALNVLKNELASLANKRETYDSEMKNLKLKIDSHEAATTELRKIISDLEQGNEWLIDEQNGFGIDGSDYDFKDFDLKNEKNFINKLKNENGILKRKVNMAVDSVADDFEKQFNELIKRREIVLRDKASIQKAIVELDSKRKIALDAIYEKVNESISNIYSGLLPGTKAKIEKVNPNDLMAGINLKVAFNNHWKESLAELSGGQISLLALSFILSLLLYKPAPIYIFDEIDAALDISHTANLGTMIKKNFPKSQFIVVSLKDGMFKNADVLYKVSFSEGTSKIDRITKAT